LIVAGKVSESAIAHTLIEELCSFVSGPHFQRDIKYPCYDGAFLEPLKKSSSKTCSSIRRSDSEKVQVCVVVSVAHDRKTGNVIVNGGHEYVNIWGTNTRGYARRCPTPCETVLD
jgi:hypothetical protein